MNPPYSITPKIMQLVSEISRQLGKIDASFLDKPAPKLRKENRIKTIHSSLAIEGNTLSEEQITALLENKRVLAPKNDILEVLNANMVYENLKQFNLTSNADFLKAHKQLMKGLISDAGKYRKKGVGIVSGESIRHIAPPADKVSFLMKDLFDYLKTDEIALIKSCVFHYEVEFIHPFSDGNGRMGRLWQTRILMEEFPIFEFIPFENLIHQNQNEYYSALSQSDKAGNSTPFIEYMLGIIQISLDDILNVQGKSMSAEDRVHYFSQTHKGTFSRKEYMLFFKSVSSATASRDLKKGVELGIFKKFGEDNQTFYEVKE